MNANIRKMLPFAVPALILLLALFLAGACSMSTGSPAPPTDAYAESLASFTQEVGELTPLGDDPGAVAVYTYAVAVGTLAGVYAVLEQDVVAVLTVQVPEETERARVLGVLDGSIGLVELMVAESGMYQDQTQSIVLGLPLEEPIPADSPIQTAGTPEPVDDGERTGMSFDSAEDYLLVPADATNDLTHQGAIAVWLKPTTNVAWAGIVHKGTQADWSDEGYSLQYDGEGRLMLAMTSAAGQSMLVRTLQAPAAGTWSHVVATWDQDEVHLYVDGVDVVDRINVGFSSTVTTIAENYPFRSSAGDVVIGTQVPGNPWRFDGLLSDVRIYDRYLEQAEVLALPGE